jgi:hypothetical protein
VAIPSGTGTEVLKNITQDANNDTERSYAVGAGNIWTILTITACNGSGTDTSANIKMYDGSGTISIWEGTVPANSTMVWSDRFVLTDTDSLKFHNGAQNFDWMISYIEQDFGA